VAKVGLREIKAALITAEGRLRCSEYLMLPTVDRKEDIITLIRYLSELREYDMAVDLALAVGESVAYPVMIMAY